MRTRGLGENSVLALAGDVASKVGALAVVVLSARLLSVAEFAVLAMGLAAAGLLGSFLDLGAGTLLTRDGAASRSDRGALLRGLLRARAPIALTVIVVSVVVGALLGQPLTAVAIAVLGVAGALSLSVLGLFRSCQDIRPEAIQRLAAGLLSIGAVAVIGLAAVPRADAVLGALAVVTLVTLAPLVWLAPRIADFGRSVDPVKALKLAAPIGLLALATVAYYRSGTLVLAALDDAHATAMFGIAASVAFGMLMLPNAITTALLPRLAAEADFASLIACSRRALGWTVVLAVALAASAAAVVPIGLPLVLGPEYREAGAPFAILCLGIPLIASSGVVGTALLSVGRLRLLGIQVGVSLAVNLLALALLVPFLGAVGAALATVTCEIVGLAILVLVARSALPGLLSLRASPVGGTAQPSSAAA